MGTGATTGRHLRETEAFANFVDDPTASALSARGARKSSLSQSQPPASAATQLGRAGRPPAGTLALLESKAIEAAVRSSFDHSSDDATSRPKHEEMEENEEVSSLLSLFLAESLCGVPYPRPWVLEKDEEGVFFVNEETGATTLQHPMQGCLHDLASLFRCCWRLPTAPLQQEQVALRRAQWEESTDKACKAWYSVTHTDGRVYYCNENTDETTWEDPLSMVLPVHFMRVRAASWLENEGYLAYLAGSASQEESQDQQQHRAQQASTSGSSSSSSSSNNNSKTQQSQLDSGLPKSALASDSAMAKASVAGAATSAWCSTQAEERTPSSLATSTSATPRSVRIPCGDPSLTPQSSEVQSGDSPRAVRSRPSTMGTLLGRTRATLLAPLDMKRRFNLQNHCRDRRVLPFPDESMLESSVCPV